MRAVHVITAISEEASGPSYSVVRLCESLIHAGISVELAALDQSPMASPPPFLRRFPFGRGPRRLAQSPAMWRWLREQRADVLHSHGMWQAGSVYAGLLGKRETLVVSPRGSLSRHAMSIGSRFKKLAWPLIQRPAIARAACFHATAMPEHDDLRRLGFRQPIAVIPNGIDVPPLAHAASTKTLLFLGRIHPTKGVDLLLRVWARVMKRFPEWKLRIVGHDGGSYSVDAYGPQMHALAASLRLERCEFVGAKYGEDKLAEYRNADLFVLPTHSENFGMSVAEAQAAGTPVVVTKGAPWSGIETERSGWWIDLGEEPLAACLETAMALPASELAARGLRGRDWMVRDFAWPTIGARMQATYRWLTEGGASPPWIAL